MSYKWKHFEMLMMVFKLSEFHLLPSFWTKCLLNLKKKRKSFDCLENSFVCFASEFLFLHLVAKENHSNKAQIVFNCTW